MSSSTIPINEKKLKAEEGKLKKIIAAIKKALSKELLWGLCIAIVSIPMALVVSYVIYTYASQEVLEVFQIIAGDEPTFVTIYIICVIGIYISRIIATAIKTQLESLKKD